MSNSEAGTIDLFFGKLNGRQLIFAKKTHVTSVLTMVGVGINVALNIPFIIKWGAIGAAWATLLAGLISGAIIFAISQRYYEIRWEYRRIGAIYLTFLASSCLMILLRGSGVDYFVRLLIKLGSISLYACIGANVGVITADNFAMVRKMLAKASFRKEEKMAL